MARSSTTGSTTTKTSTGRSSVSGKGKPDLTTSAEAARTSGAGRQGFAHRLYTGEVSYDFVGKRRLWYTVSAVLLLVSLGALLLRGLDLGIEFRGGSDFQAPTQVSGSTVADVRSAVQGSGVPNLESATITTIGDSKVRVQTRSLEVGEQAKVRQAIARATGSSEDKVAYQLIGASWGKQITQKAAIALVVFLVLVGVLIWLYFRDAKMSIAALVALAHDLVITVGIYALVGFTVTPTTVIGILTILGYSLYDTVVVFDKVRENVADMEAQRITYSDAANAAVNQVLVRSLNTTVIGVLPVAALLFAGTVVLGSGPLEDLGLALFVGMIAGAYSSIFIATPLLAQMREREPGMAAHRERLARRRTNEERKTTATALVDVPVTGRATTPVSRTVNAVPSVSDDPDPVPDEAEAKTTPAAGTARPPQKSGGSTAPRQGKQRPSQSSRASRKKR